MYHRRRCDIILGRVLFIRGYYVYQRSQAVQSVFLINEPGALKNFAELFVRENVDVIAISQDVRYDAAVVRLTVKYDQEISHTLTKAGFTSVKTDAICIDTPNRVGLLRDIGARPLSNTG